MKKVVYIHTKASARECVCVCVIIKCKLVQAPFYFTTVYTFVMAELFKVWVKN